MSRWQSSTCGAAVSPRRVHHGDFRAGPEAPMGFCAATAAGDAALPAAAERYQLQLLDQRLREGKAVGAGFELVARGEELLAGAERDQLQLLDQRLREGKAVGAGLELVARDAALLAGAERDQLQLRELLTS